jgi:phosphoribosylpyrophosphate synthetase
VGGENSIPILGIIGFPLTRLEQVSAAALFAEAIRQLHSGGSIVELQGG